MLHSAKARKLVELMPADWVITETDVPFSQIDGEPLMPWDVSKTHPYLADMWQCRAGEVAARIKGNLKVILALKVCTVGHGVRLAALCGAGVVMTRN